MAADGVSMANDSRRHLNFTSGMLRCPESVVRHCWNPPTEEEFATVYEKDTFAALIRLRWSVPTQHVMVNEQRSKARLGARGLLGLSG